MTLSYELLLQQDPNNTGKNISWNGHSRFSDGIVSYSFPTSLASYYDNCPTDGTFDSGYSSSYSE